MFEAGHMLFQTPFEIMTLCLAHDPVHELDCLNRVFSHRGFRREHDRVRSIEDRIRHVRSFGARWEWVRDHRFKHLGGSDHQLGVQVGGTDDVLLLDRYAFRWKLHAQIAARHHHTVHILQDIVQVIECFRLFELGNQQRKSFAV